MVNSKFEAENQLLRAAAALTRNAKCAKAI